MYEDSVAHILDILRSGFNTDFKNYYEGDPLQLGDSSIPAICVMKESGQFELGPTGFDKLTETITIKVILDKRDDLGASDNVDLTERKLRKLVEGVDPATNQYYTKSVLGLLRANITLQGTSFDHVDRVRYGVVPRNMREDFWTSEAHIQLALTRITQVPNRT